MKIMIMITIKNRITSAANDDVRTRPPRGKASPETKGREEQRRATPSAERRVPAQAAAEGGPGAQSEPSTAREASAATRRRSDTRVSPHSAASRGDARRRPCRPAAPPTAPSFNSAFNYLSRGTCHSAPPVGGRGEARGKEGN